MRHPASERRRLQQLEPRRNYLGEVLDFLDSLLILTDAVRPTYDEATTALRPGGEPPLSLPRFPLDEAAAARAFDAFLGLFERGVAASEAAAVRQALAAGALSPADACRAFLTGDAEYFERVRETAGVDATFLARLAELALKTQAVERARRYEVSLEEAATRCPVCASAPDLAVLADRGGFTGARIGVCGFCESEWRLPRAACAQCGADDPALLGYLHAKEDAGVRAAVCDACKSYLIVVEARGRLDFAPAVERAAALPLDVVAQAEGYVPITPTRGLAPSAAAGS